MNAQAKFALPWVIVGVAVAYVMYLGLTTTWQYYVLVDECGMQAEQWRGKRLRVNGKVEKDSLHISQDRRTASFILSGDKHQIPVRCSGPLPDNLADCMDVVVEGVLQDDGHLQGQRVITRCASKYAPKDSSSPAPVQRAQSPY